MDLSSNVRDLQLMHMLVVGSSSFTNFSLLFQKAHRGSRATHPGRVPIGSRGQRQLGLSAYLDGGQLLAHWRVPTALQADPALPQGTTRCPWEDLSRLICVFLKTSTLKFCVFLRKCFWACITLVKDALGGFWEQSSLATFVWKQHFQRKAEREINQKI